MCPFIDGCEPCISKNDCPSDPENCSYYQMMIFKAKHEMRDMSNKELTDYFDTKDLALETWDFGD